MKIVIIIVVICMCALGVVGAVGFFTNGFSSFDKENVKSQLSSLKESVQDLTNKVGEAFKKDPAEDKPACAHENIDDKGVCTDCGTCTHKYIFGGVCEGCGKSVDEIRANCEHEMDGCVCTKCGYDTHDVDPDTYQCRKCGMLIIRTNSVCLNGHADQNGDGQCDYCGTTMEQQQQERTLERIQFLGCRTYEEGDEISANDVSISLIYSDGSVGSATPDYCDGMDTSVAGVFTAQAYYCGLSCSFEYMVNAVELDGPTGSGEQMVEEDGEW